MQKIKIVVSVDLRISTEEDQLDSYRKQITDLGFLPADTVEDEENEYSFNTTGTFPNHTAALKAIKAVIEISGVYLYGITLVKWVYDVGL